MVGLMRGLCEIYSITELTEIAERMEIDYHLPSHLGHWCEHLSARFIVSWLALVLVFLTRIAIN